MAETSNFAANVKSTSMRRVSRLTMDCSDTTEFDEEPDEDEDYSYSDVSDAVELPSPGAKGSESISFNPNVGK